MFQTFSFGINSIFKLKGLNNFWEAEHNMTFFILKEREESVRIKLNSSLISGKFLHRKFFNIQWCIFIFSCESGSRIANVCLSVCLTFKPFGLLNWPSSLFEPIDRQAHWSLSPLTIEPADLWSSFVTFKPFGLLIWLKNLVNCH